tara:strand:+ start:3349 stop:3843 length:495 start_codon:yes stop_codon:yes gene_type:complete
MSVSLRDLTEDQTAILAQVESGDFSLDDVADHLELLDSERKDKIESYLHVINRLYSEVKMVTAELDRLHDIESAKAKALERVKSWLLVNMKDGEKFEYPLFKVSRSKGREVVSITDEKAIPMDYFNIKPETWAVDKKLVLSQLKAGETIPGAEIKRGNSSLRIK